MSLYLSKTSIESSCPQKWKLVDLHTIVTSLDSRRIPIEASRRSSRKGAYRYYGASGIIDYIDDFIFDEETLLVAEDGANLLARSTPIAFKVSGKYWVNNHAHVLKIKEQADIDFVNYFLNQIDLEPYITGSAQPKLNADKLQSIKIPLPPIAEQKRIAAIAQKADRLRRTRRYTLELSDSYLRSVFLEMFGDPITNPRGWDISTIGELVKVETGGTPDRTNSNLYGGAIPWVKTGEVTGSVIYQTEEHLTEEGLQSSNCRLFPIGTIIIAMYGQGLTRGRSAKLGIEATTNQACAAILPSQKINSDYLWALLRVSYEELRDLGRGGNQPNLNLELVRSFRVICPPLPLQKKFAQIVQRFERLRIQQREAERQAEHLFQTILYRAFRGEL
ncbi:MAG TPA: restriction endonuclease subunit S [Leptolyngbyaceae cyanobacterium M33_DOE_097]|nr:restriction endonuclease subunit S [Leptolyngbyaceae cyanobacterium M33_DOE_097]